MRRSATRLIAAAATLACVSAVTVAAALSATAAPSATAALSATAGSSRPTCHGQRATIVGNNQRNIIRGTNHRDVIAAGGGADIILGRGGNDLICAGPGHDVVAGGPGLDRVYGGSGRDLCYGLPVEHRRYHFGCEVHVPDSAGGPGSPRAAQGRVVRGHPTRAQTRAMTRVFHRVVGPQAGAALPACDARTGIVTLGHANVTGYGTNPSLVAVRPKFLPYNQVDGTFEAVQYPSTDQWNIVNNIPNDGTLYQVPVPAYQLTNFRTYTVFYDVAWSADGTSWNGPTIEFRVNSYQDPYGFPSPAETCVT